MCQNTSIYRWSQAKLFAIIIANIRRIEIQICYTIGRMCDGLLSHDGYQILSQVQFNVYNVYTLSITHTAVSVHRLLVQAMSN